ncbi:MAG: hypothetical protein IPN18_22060 [Ignavibacteriales bacterium]|nr:hypothetical protein [Ignavibacteriales bacterium]
MYKGYGSLATVITHEFKYDGFSLKVQFNPGRMTSTSAKVDPKSIKERKCFLCEASLPAAQERLEYKNGYRILVNLSQFSLNILQSQKLNIFRSR